MRRTFKYRLYPTRVQAEALASVLDRCRVLYNAALQERRDAWKMRRVSVAFAQQSAQLLAVKADRPEYAEVYAQVLQDVLHRVDKTCKAFYRRCGQGQTGYPRFKGRDRYDSFTYPQLGDRGVKLAITGGKLALPKIGRVRIKLHRALEGLPKTLTIKRESGKWYALLSCVVEPEPLPPSDNAIGIDLGLESFLVTSDGEFVDNPRHLRKAEVRLAKAQQVLSRRARGGNRRRKARSLVAVHHASVANARRDFHHKLARRLVNENGFLALEGLRIKNMVRNHSLAKSISDAGWGQFVSILLAKAEEAGREVVLVNPRNTSQTCSGCGRLVPKALSERWHACPCGVSLHRDVNASRNILALGRSVQARA